MLGLLGVLRVGVGWVVGAWVGLAGIGIGIGIGLLRLGRVLGLLGVLRLGRILLLRVSDVVGIGLDVLLSAEWLGEDREERKQCQGE